MNNPKILVIGATGLVGSQITKILADKGHDVTAMIRKEGTTISDAPQSIKYVLGDLKDRNSLDNAVKGMDIVISTANGVIPPKGSGTAKFINQLGSDNLIEACELAGVKRFAQSSVPELSIGHQVPEIAGKRILENRLKQSTMESRIVRNPAFYDVWLVMGGFKQAENKDPHSTTLRSFGFMQTWKKAVGNFVKNHCLFIAPGGAKHGSVFIATIDVAHMITAAALKDGEKYMVIESGGPEWLSWGEVANQISNKMNKKKVRVINLPAGAARFFQLVMYPFSKSAANVMALTRMVATYQPKWDSKPVVEYLDLPPQQTLKDYLDIHVKD
ncbi:NAD-dependent epimerase/dehydratase family protein [uncultured Aquimarina sp.]|uniref:SDR family oxidoreductase n=1 Tax=uncultured Aquimarina sp. TaxID=575652 RepID=UPI0026162947|nr:NAD-dependent epimerase/dehydratase family protein [uncultured Aquimarina sp.]